MLSDAVKALGEILTRPFWPVLVKSVGATALLFIVMFLALEWVLGAFVPFATGWVELLVQMLLGATLLIAFWFVAAPLTALVAGILVDDIAETVERVDYPGDVPGRAPGVVEGLVQAIRFGGVVLLANIVALMLLLVPGINLIAFLLANAFLLGREYFELCALRHLSRQDMALLRARHAGKLFVAGLIIAGFLVIPVVNFLTPLFATTFMMHVYKRLETDMPMRTRLPSSP